MALSEISFIKSNQIKTKKKILLIELSRTDGTVHILSCVIWWALLRNDSGTHARWHAPWLFQVGEESTANGMLIMLKHLTYLTMLETVTKSSLTTPCGLRAVRGKFRSIKSYSSRCWASSPVPRCVSTSHDKFWPNTPTRKWAQVSTRRISDVIKTSPTPLYRVRKKKCKKTLSIDDCCRLNKEQGGKKRRRNKIKLRH